jgi:dihydrofolate synthase / folylpolyglutamate synthase
MPQPSSLPTVPAADGAAAILDRLQTLYPQLIDLSLDRVTRLLADLGDPQLRIPPMIHVAGTNGKGSTCAFLRAMGEAAGWRVHVTTSPHLVRLNERFRIAGALVSDGVLESTLAEIEQVNAGKLITVFEVLAAAGYLLFSRTQADLCVVEVGLGGRFDATNVVASPAATSITSISLDHREFLGDNLAKIAWEKAGIIKPGRPVVCGAQPPDVFEVLRDCAAEAAAPLMARGRDWDIAPAPNGLSFRDNNGAIDIPMPSLSGAHQLDNAGIAVASLRASGLTLPAAAYQGIAQASWPARLQRLHGALAARLPPGFELYLDGGHNADAGRVLADYAQTWADRPLYLAVGMKRAKDATGFLAPLLAAANGAWAVAEPNQHLAMSVPDIIEASGGVVHPGPDIAGALAQITRRPPGRVLICGSLYLAGEALKADGTLPQ